MNNKSLLPRRGICQVKPSHRICKATNQAMCQQQMMNMCKRRVHCLQIKGYLDIVSFPGFKDCRGSFICNRRKYPSFVEHMSLESGCVALKQNTTTSTSFRATLYKEAFVYINPQTQNAECSSVDFPVAIQVSRSIL